ncbi:MAG: CHAT domain-containing protein, partial [Anaerolineae bacterium]
MAVTLSLRTENDCIVAARDGQSLASTPLAGIPSPALVQADPLNHGRALYAALGGDALRALLDADDERLLLLDADTTADAIPWEFAALPEHQFLAASYGLVRLLDQPAPVLGRHEALPLHFVALAADPLVDQQDRPREGYRLKVEDEMRKVRDALSKGRSALEAERVAPTKEALDRALQRGPAILHLTCHGDLVNTTHGPQAVLLLEDANGKMDMLYGSDLAAMPTRGDLRLVLLSACRTAEGRDSRLARALVQSGVPFAIGMQSTFPDDLSDDIAVALYESILNGKSLAEGLRRMRNALRDYPTVFGLPVGYAAREGWKPLPLAQGRPTVPFLGLPGDAQLAGQVQPPRPLLGRNGELHALAALYASGHKVVTVTGTGGMGKTALAASFAERFAWRWPGGVRAYSFASEVVDAPAFRLALLRLLRGEEVARNLADA